jgi:glycosyltransferase involved in cell wall biosynthesis
MEKLAIITTHPIQYNAPLFRMLTQRNKIELKVFYTWSQSEFGIKFDPGFGKNIEWDLPLLEGYNYCFSKNVSASPGSHHYKGIDNPNLITEIKDWAPHALLIYGWNFKSHFKTIRYFKGKIPVLFRGDSTLLDEKPGIKKIIRRLFLKFVYNFIDIALFAGITNKAYFRAHGIKEEQLFFMPHAIDNKRFAAKAETETTSFRKILNIPTHALVFLFAGKLEAKKQPDILLEVFLRLKSSNIFLIIAGSGALENVLKTQYSNIENIKFVGFQNQQQMPLLYSSCDVFILPSKGPGETWGLSINEAMAAGRAIIASDACGAAYDLVENNVNGFVFEKNDKVALQKNMQYFIDNKMAAFEMGKKSVQKLARFSFLEDCISVENILNQMGKNK